MCILVEDQLSPTTDYSTIARYETTGANMWTTVICLEIDNDIIYVQLCLSQYYCQLQHLCITIFGGYLVFPIDTLFQCLFFMPILSL